jgi:RND family efflux transporter MFP subunit
MGATALATFGLCLAGCGRDTAPTGKAEPPAPKVGVVVARKQNVPIIGQPNGTTRALNNVTIRARVKGFLKEKHFAEGSNVKKGQLLLVIDEEPFKVKVAQSKAVLDEAEATLKKARESKSREVSKALVALDETQLQLDKVEERRERSLLARKAASQEDYDRARAKAEKSAAQVQSSAASLQQAVSDYDINILTAQANVEKARADLDSATIEFSYCRMSAPIDGRIGELQVKLGNLVGPAAGSTDTTSLVSIQQLDPMGVDIRPASRYLPIITKLVKSGLDVKLSVQGTALHPYTGKVVFLDNAVDPTTSTVLVKASVPNPEQTLLPGEYVRVELNVGDYAGVVVVPDQAVVEAQEGSRVLLVDDQNKVQLAVVKPLEAYQGLLALESGLEPGQKVIVEGIQLVRPGQIVLTEEISLDKFIRTLQVTENNDPLASPLVRLRGSDAEEPRSQPDLKDTGRLQPRSKTPAPPEKTSTPPAVPRD